MIYKHKQIALGLLSIMARRNRWLVSQYEDLCFLPVRSRIAKLLLDLSEQGQEIIMRGNHPISELAARISTSPEVFSRSISYLSDRGFIKSDRLSINVSNPEMLRKIITQQVD